MTQRLWHLGQRALAVIGLVALSPVVVAIGLVVRATSPGPVFFRSTRISGGRAFTILKFRTMRTDASGPAITAACDPRVTRVGALLRRWKVDEIPQLWNVVRGQMLLVGPRPEDPRYVDWSDPLHALVFGARAGITGPAALSFRNEEQLLYEAARALASADGRDAPDGDDVDRAYREAVLPRKLRLDAEYLRNRSVSRDVRVLVATVLPGPGRTNRP
jgi:lipopolysaccharide/colanic/teichoic acid biosynthesis glycosyltransferase